jgi:hypothetical protein
MRITHTHTKKNPGNYKIAVGKNEIKKVLVMNHPRSSSLFWCSRQEGIT